MYIAFVLVIFLIVCAVLFNFNKSDNSGNEKLEKVRLAEVAHTIFYAPMYVAIEEGYFEEKGINIELTLASGADKVSAAVLAGDADIGFAGSEATIYVYNGGEKDYLKTFAQLTQKDGSFIVARENIEDFTLEDLVGKTIIGGRTGGMPEMTLEWSLTDAGIDPKNDLNIDTSVAFSAMSSAFIGGTGDFVALFEPNALQLEQEGYGYVVASLGELGGIVPYTAFFARDSYLNDNKELVANFEEAIQMGLDFVHSKSDEEVAEAIIDQFPDTSLEDLTKVVARYRSIDAWPETTEFTEEAFDHLQDIMINANELESKVPFSDLMYEE
ncbi:MAG TPA: ABC transporter substrate-binding protein [Candidatus Onthousia faecavium]|nr:ABC transporter substrate-binding protein [Candidatus Onthousia faecavium]